MRLVIHNTHAPNDTSRFVTTAPTPQRWLERFYRNSNAHIQRSIQQHSVDHQRTMLHLRKCWNNPPSITIVPSPGTWHHIEASLDDDEELEAFKIRQARERWISNGPDMRM